VVMEIFYTRIDVDSSTTSSHRAAGPCTPLLKSGGNQTAARPSGLLASEQQPVGRGGRNSSVAGCHDGKGDVHTMMVSLPHVKYEMIARTEATTIISYSWNLLHRTQPHHDSGLRTRYIHPANTLSNRQTKQSSGITLSGSDPRRLPLARCYFSVSNVFEFSILFSRFLIPFFEGY
jgi:hypothetical protein